MAPPLPRGSGQRRSRGKHVAEGGRFRCKGEAFTQKRSHFKTSRLEEDREESDIESAPPQIEREVSCDAEAERPPESSDDETGPHPRANSYTVLLQALHAPEPVKPPARKRRKISNGDLDGRQGSGNDDPPVVQRHGTDEDGPTRERPNLGEEDVDKLSGSESGPEAAAREMGSDDEDTEAKSTALDPYESHFTHAESHVLSAHLAIPPAKRWMTQPTRVVDAIRITTVLPSSADVTQHGSPRQPQEMHFKTRLRARAELLLEEMDTTQKELASPIFQYMDLISGARRFQDPAKLRDIVALHALDHVFKTRDHVIKNNARLGQRGGGESPDLRDQGFTRPKVLFLLPTRQSCVQLVDSIVSICKPEQQEYKARFQESFGGRPGDEKWDDKPDDFRDLFSGNDDDMFRVGLKFTRKTIKYFSAFYSSDIIIASPLGLRTTIENSSHGKEKKRGHDADFLSSIEIVVVDHANALQMQNWQHVEYVFSQLNLLPKEAHGCDFSRVRTWYLDKYARHLRQTIVLSDFITPEINALSSAHMLNVAGRVRSIPVYKGAMLKLPPSVPPNTGQTFLRYDSPTPTRDPNARFQYFTSTIIASLLRDRHSKGTLIFIPSSFDFVRLRNYFATSNETASLSFGAISEYTSVRDVMRARSHFLSGRHSVLLYSERAHHFRRYRLKGVHRVIFYGVPENPLFWPEVVGFFGSDNSETGRGKGAIKAIFSKWDALKMERIVGTERVRKLVADRSGDTFDFV